jgi:hypothetical protein
MALWEHNNAGYPFLVPNYVMPLIQTEFGNEIRVQTLFAKAYFIAMHAHYKIVSDNEIYFITLLEPVRRNF